MATTTTFALALTTTHRMIDWVHDHAADVGTTTQMTCASGFPAGHIHVIDVANLADGRISLNVDAADLTGWHLHQSVITFTVVKDDLLTGRPRDLTTSARHQLDVMDTRSKRNGSEGQRITSLWRCVGTRRNT